MKELNKYLPFNYHSNYELKTAEAWRWNRLDAFYLARQVERAELKVNAPVKFIEDFPMPDSSCFNEQDSPLAKLNLDLGGNFFYSYIGESEVLKEPAVMHIQAVGAKLQLSKIFAVVKTNGKGQVWIDLSAEQNAWQNLVLQLELWENANLDLVLYLGEGDQSSQNAQSIMLSIHQAKNSFLNVNCLEKSSSFARVDVISELKGEGAVFNFGGIQQGGGKGNVDYHIQALHLAPNCQSKQVIRGILEDEALGIFSGLIKVAQGCPQTVANQDSRYLLLTDNALALSMPQLEIYSDDVKCNHGATVGKLDSDSLFYLQSRGISKYDAEKILISSFLNEAIVVKGMIKEKLVEQLVVSS